MRQMRAIVIDSNGNLELRDVPTPEPGPGQVRVRVRAVGVNRADLLQRRGMHPAPADAPQDIPGLEVAGEVDAIGGGVIDVRPGDRVYGLVSGGGYAESVVVPARTLAPIPVHADGPLGFAEAAAVPEAFLTAYDAMVLQGGLAAGETVLVHAVGSGVGTAAVQIARAIGAVAIGTARTEDKLARAKELGMRAGVVVDGKAPRFADRVRAENGGRGADVVLELVGGAYVAESLAALDDRGRLVLVGLLAGARGELDFAAILRRRLQIHGTVMRVRPLEEKIAMGQVLARNLSPLVASGALVPIVDRVLPLDRAAEAHDLLASNVTFGKIVLSI